MGQTPLTARSVFIYRSVWDASQPCMKHSRRRVHDTWPAGLKYSQVTCAIVQAKPGLWHVWREYRIQDPTILSGLSHGLMQQMGSSSIVSWNAKSIGAIFFFHCFDTEIWDRGFLINCWLHCSLWEPEQTDNRRALCYLISRDHGNSKMQFLPLNLNIPLVVNGSLMLRD